MSHEYTDPSLPLTNDQRVVSSGQVLASGEANFFDFIQSQDSEFSRGSGINVRFPSPSNFVSGAYITYGPEDLLPADQDQESGIFNFYGKYNQFSSASVSEIFQINDFTIFNPYIHYDKLIDYNSEYITEPPVLIPYLSDYKISTLPPSPYT